MITTTPSLAQPVTLGILGVKLPVRDLGRSRRWYERILDLELIMEFPDDDGVVRGVAYAGPGGIGLSLRERPDLAGLRGFDPVAFCAPDATGVHAWADRLTALGVEHRLEDAPIGPIVIFADPDGLELHVYARDGIGLPAAERDTPTDHEVAELVTDTARAAAAWMQGDLDRYLELTVHARGFTLAPPLGGRPVSHADRDGDLRAWRSTFADGGGSFELVRAHAWADTVVVVGVERLRGRVGDLPDQDWGLRVTQVLRRSGGTWQLVHRHADPLVEPLDPSRAAALARGDAA